MTSGLGGWEGLLERAGLELPPPLTVPHPGPMPLEGQVGGHGAPPVGHLSLGPPSRVLSGACAGRGVALPTASLGPHIHRAPPPCPSIPSAPARPTPCLGGVVDSICRKPSQGPTASELLQCSHRQSLPFSQGPPAFRTDALYLQPCVALGWWLTLSVSLGGLPISPT